MSATEWAFVTIAWVFGFLPGFWLGSQWAQDAADKDDMDDLYVNLFRPEEERP